MWPFTRVKRPPIPRLVDLDERLTSVEKSIDWLRKADRELNARLSSVQRVTRTDAIADQEVPPPDPRLAAPAVDSDQVERRRRMRGF